MKVTGTIINYFFHCKRQCWLFANRINLEENSEDVRIGRILHELKMEGQKDTEVSIENIKVDKITDDYLVEIKKSDADIDATSWQLLFYLKILKDKGVLRKGKMEFVEKNKQSSKIHYLELTDDKEKELQEIIGQIDEFISQTNPPMPIMGAKCKKCAYYEYCFI